MRAAVLSLCPLLALSRAYWKYDAAHQHRRAIGKCKKFECPAFQRPVQKPWDEFTPTAPDVTPNIREIEPDKSEKGLSVCTASKYVCAQTCGIDFQECYDTYWKCAETICRHVAGPSGGENDHCLAAAQHNDIYYFTFESVMAHFMPTPKPDEVCEQFQEMQRDACDCVPHKDHEDKLKERLVDFYQHHDKEKLTAKGKVKDKNFWKAWRGKRPVMFYSLMMEKPGEAFKQESFEKAPYPGAKAKRRAGKAEL